MPQKKLSHTIALYCIVLALLLTVVLGTVGYSAYKSSLLERYQIYTQSLLDIAAAKIDSDDLSQCIQTETESENYLIAQEMLCSIKRNSQISHIYIVYFPEPSTPRKMRFAMNGFTEEEAGISDYISHIGDESVLGMEGSLNADFDYEMAGMFWECLYNGQEDGTFYYVNDTDVYGYQMTGYQGIFRKDGGGTAVLALDISMDKIKDNLNRYLIITGVAAVMLLLLFLAVFLMVLTRNMISPIKNLAFSAHDFVLQSHRFSEEPEKLEYRSVDIRTRDEIQLLGESMQDMTSEIKAYMVNLKTVVEEKGRISAELRTATDIQVSMLPRLFPAFPNREEFDIYATMHPAKEVGGDFYDFFFVDQDHLCIVIADVSGKGVPAALFMVIAKTLIKNNTLTGEDMAQAFTHTNQQLCENNDAGLFVTAWAGVLEISTGKMVYVNAGHNPPVIKHKDGEFSYLRCRPGFVLAGMDGFRYRQNEMVLDHGDTLYLYTDGVTEAADSEENLFGEERLLNTLNTASEVPMEHLLKKVAEDVDAFVNGAQQSDDITMLGLHFM